MTETLIKTNSLIRLYKVDEIKHFMLKDNLYKSVLQIDNIDDWLPDLFFTSWFIVCVDNIKVGIIAFKQFSNNCYEFHGGMLEAYRGKNTSKLLRWCLQEVRKELTFRYVTKVSQSNKRCLKLLDLCGFKQIAIIKNGYKKDNLVLLEENINE